MFIRNFSMPYASLSTNPIPLGPPNINNVAHDTEKPLVNTQVGEEVNLSI